MPLQRPFQTNSPRLVARSAGMKEPPGQMRGRSSLVAEACCDDIQGAPCWVSAEGVRFLPAGEGPTAGREGVVRPLSIAEATTSPDAQQGVTCPQ